MKRAAGRSVALAEDGGYSERVHKLVLQRWALILLLIGRLVIGELGHAMPMPAMGHVPAAAQEQALPCPEHEAAAQQVETAQASAQSHSDDGGDCCKSGECECPCLHVPCASVEPVTTHAPRVELRQKPEASDALLPQCPSGLFRPPA